MQKKLASAYFGNLVSAKSIKQGSIYVYIQTYFNFFDSNISNRSVFTARKDQIFPEKIE